MDIEIALTVGLL